MKIYSAYFALLFSITLFLFGSFPQKASAQDVEVSYQSFYDDLSPYGQWVEDPEYGQVWIPNEGLGFRPYGTRGHWVMTEYGNMWVSDDPWGWACYHYGRWTYNSYYGWVWIPGYEWAPAWVSWRSGGGYYGWAPMGPGYMIGSVYSYPDEYWIFVGPEYLYQPDVYGHCNRGHAARYIRKTSYMNETSAYGTRSTYYYGPRREAIERETHQPVQVYRVSDAHQPRQTRVSGNEVAIYRPAIDRGTANTARPANTMRGAQPVGKPQDYTPRDARREPEFRQATRQPGNGMQTPTPDRGNQGGRRPERSVPQDDIYQPRRDTRVSQPDNSRSAPDNRRERQPSRNEPQNNQPERQPWGRPRAQPEPGRQPNSSPQQEPARPAPRQQPRQQPREQPQPARQQPEPQRAQPEPQRAQPEPQRAQPEPRREQPEKREESRPEQSRRGR